MKSKDPNKIARLIEAANRSYYNGRPPIMTDEEYDGLKNTLREIDPGHTLLSKVGYQPEDNTPWKKASHQMPMGSLNNVFNEEDFRKWTTRFSPGTRFTAQPKLDGASLEIIYDSGLLKQGITRGDGTEGEDITRNVRKMVNVPGKLETSSYSGSIRGEILLSKDDFEAINEQLSEDEQYSNPRNAAAGICRRLDGKYSDRLLFLPYDMTYKMLEEYGIDSQEDEDMKLEVLKNLGFKKPLQVIGDTDKMVEAYTEMGKRREQYPFNIDGVVIKVCSGKIQQEQGIVGGCPRAQIAWKFDPPGALTTFKEETWDVGRTGVITPLAWLEPVEIDGSTISKATLHNLDEIERLGIGRGDTVMVVKAGDIIPKITRVIEHRGNPIIIPTECPSCKSMLERDGPMLYCRNDLCPRKNMHRIMNFIKVAKIDGFGEALVNELLDKSRLPDGIRSIYSDLKTEHIADLEGWGEKTAKAIVGQIQKSRGMKPVVFLAAMGVPGVSEKTAEELLQEFGSIQSLMAEVKDRDSFITHVKSMKGYGETSAISIQENLAKYANEILTLEPYLQLVEDTSEAKSEDTPSFCITGSLNKPKSFYQELIEKRGWGYSNSLTKDITYLVCNEDKGSSKSVKAKKYGTKIITEQELVELLGVIQEEFEITKKPGEVEEASLF